MLDYVEKQKGQGHYGTELQESAQTQAERMITQAGSEGVTEENLLKWRKGHPAKMKLAMKLRSETTVTVAWIAQRLRMGTRQYLDHLLWKAKSPAIADQQPTLRI
jgi:hypothetical protein